jgi:hypothetical protein
MTELAHRRNDDVEVSLLWDRERDRLFVLVEDVRAGERFSLQAPRDHALDVYYHPFAYAAPETGLRSEGGRIAARPRAG